MNSASRQQTQDTYPNGTGGLVPDPDDPTVLLDIKYVDVPQIEYKDVFVPKRQIVEVEKRVTRTELVEVERVVEVPQVEWTDRTVEVPQVQIVQRIVPRKEVIDVPVERIRHVPRVEIVIREDIREIPGEIIEVPKPYVVENKIPVDVFRDTEVPTVVAQTVRPICHFTNPDGTIPESEIPAVDYEPVLVPVKVFIPKPISSTAVFLGSRTDGEHHLVDVPVAQYNTLLKNLNPNLKAEQMNSILRRDASGATPMLSTTATTQPPLSGRGLIPPPLSGRSTGSHPIVLSARAMMPSNALEASQTPSIPNFPSTRPPPRNNLQVNNTNNSFRGSQVINSSGSIGARSGVRRSAGPPLPEDRAVVAQPVAYSFGERAVVAEKKSSSSRRSKSHVHSGYRRSRIESSSRRERLLPPIVEVTTTTTSRPSRSQQRNHHHSRVHSSTIDERRSYQAVSPPKSRSPSPTGSSRRGTAAMTTTKYTVLPSQIIVKESSNNGGGAYRVYRA